MELELTRLFVKVVQNGSFSKAAKLLNKPKSTLSKAVSKLEKETGTKLLLRTTRSLTLTPAGRVFYETCLGPLQALEEAQKSLHGLDSLLTGPIKITAPEDFGTHVIAPIVADLSKEFPLLHFNLHYTDDIVDLIKDGFDLAIRIGKLSESSLKSKKIGEVRLIPVASMAYLKQAAKIRTPKDLESHSCLTISAQSHRQWLLRSKKESTAVSIIPKIESNQMTSLLHAALRGAGVAFLPMWLSAPEIKTGNLVRLLPEWSGQGLPVSLVSPLSSSASARLKLVSDRIYESVKNALSLEV